MNASPKMGDLKPNSIVSSERVLVVNFNGIPDKRIVKDFPNAIFKSADIKNLPEGIHRILLETELHALHVLEECQNRSIPIERVSWENGQIQLSVLSIEDVIKEVQRNMLPMDKRY